MNLYKSFKKLCTPASLYLVLSLLGLIMVAYQNMYNTHTLCIGNYSCSVPNMMLIYFFNLIYILFWTWVLQLICKSGWASISWLLVLFPFVLVFLFVFLGMNEN